MYTTAQPHKMKEKVRNLSTTFYNLQYPDPPREALEFYTAYARRAEGPILEPMCGSGRFILPMKVIGFDIHGVDFSSDMLESCWHRARKKGVYPELFEQDVTQLNLKAYYGMVFIPSGSFGLITKRPLVLKSLMKIREHMKPGGKLVLEIETPFAFPQAFRPGLVGRHEMPDGAVLSMSQNQVTFDNRAEDKMASCVRQYRLTRGQEVVAESEHKFKVRFYHPDIFKRFLEAAGFVAIRIYRPYVRKAPLERDPMILFEAINPTQGDWS